MKNQTVEKKQNLNCMRNKRILIHIISLLVILTVIILSVSHGRYSVDAHHWGLMLSNAKDLYEGKLPYKDIFIQYGILTTLIHSFSYAFLGGNLIGLILITSIFYAIGLWYLYVLGAYITKSSRIGFFILVTAILIHPTAVYPWSNYIAFPFLMIGIYVLVKYPQKYNYKFFSGIILSCAVLSREGLAPAVLLFICATVAIDCYKYKLNLINIIRTVSYTSLGLFIPIILFLFYLKSLDLLQFWNILSWQLPKVYASTMFMHMSGINIFNPFVNFFINGIIAYNIKIIIYLVIILINFLAAIMSVLYIRKCDNAIKYLKVSVLTICLITSALHIPEIFRLSTGCIVGVVIVYELLKVLKIDIIFFVVSSLILLNNNTDFKVRNIIAYNAEEIETRDLINLPKYFKGQRWSKSRSDYYLNIEKDLNIIHEAKCNISYHFNHTLDSFLQILSPFTQYQVAPFYTADTISSLRPDIKSKEKMELDKKIIILQMVQNIHRDIFQSPSGYYIYKKYYSPEIPFIPNNHTLLIMIPNECKNKIDLIM